MNIDYFDMYRQICLENNVEGVIEKNKRSSADMNAPAVAKIKGWFTSENRDSENCMNDVDFFELYRSATAANSNNPGT